MLFPNLDFRGLLVAILFVFIVTIAGCFQLGRFIQSRDDAAEVRAYDEISAQAQFQRKDCQMKLEAQDAFFKDHIYTSDGNWIPRKSFKL